jgi:RecB family exonuclease
MSPTHLNTFIDTEYGGPDSFLLQTLLRFPQAPGEDGEFGNAIHATLEWVQRKIEKDKRIANMTDVLKKFDEIMKHKYIHGDAVDNFRNRGHKALTAYITARSEMLEEPAKAEVDFRLEGVVIDSAHLSGKIDRIEINAAEKSIDIVDFKTGKPHTKWDREVKLLKYKQQLYFYKLLIEGSHSWANYKVAQARLEFVEPDANGNIVDPLLINFDENEEKEMKQLIVEIWNMIQDLNLPDVSLFSPDYRGAVSFIESIIKK